MKTATGRSAANFREFVEYWCLDLTALYDDELSTEEKIDALMGMYKVVNNV